MIIFQLSKTNFHSGRLLTLRNIFDNVGSFIWNTWLNTTQCNWGQECCVLFLFSRVSSVITIIGIQTKVMTTCSKWITNHSGCCYTYLYVIIIYYKLKIDLTRNKKKEFPMCQPLKSLPIFNGSLPGPFLTLGMNSLCMNSLFPLWKCSSFQPHKTKLTMPSLGTFSRTPSKNMVCFLLRKGGIFLGIYFKINSVNFLLLLRLVNLQKQSSDLTFKFKCFSLFTFLA